MDKLAGKRILVTRPKKQSGKFTQLLEAKGAIPICFPVIEISPLNDFGELDQALLRLAEYDWFVLTSVNGVEAVWKRLDVLNIQRLPDSLKTACIGPKTAATLGKNGVQADFVPNEYIAEAILPGLGELKGLNVLLARADIARPDLPEAIRAGGGTADDVCAYRTLPAEMDRNGLEQIIQGLDVLTFTSPSTVDNFWQIMVDEGLNPLNLPGNPEVMCIGPITARAAQAKGFQVSVIPEDYTIEGLLNAIQNHFQENEHE